MKILFATDGSEHSEGAARFLSKLDFSGDDEIFIVHVINWAPVISEWETLYTDLREVGNEIAPRIIQSAEEILKSTGAKISTSVMEGYPDREIVERASASGAELVVMGSRGMRGLASRIVGSVTKQVAIHSHNPVMVINPPQQEKTGALKVLFATDGSVYSDSMVHTVTQIPFPADTEVTVLNVSSSVLDLPERFAVELSDRIKDVVAREKEKEIENSEKIIEKTRGGLSKTFSRVYTLAKSGDPSEVIVGTAEDSGFDLVCVGSSGMRGIRGILGSVSRYVLNHCNSSVLIGKA